MENNKRMVGGISRKLLERLPMYYHYLDEKCRDGVQYISAPAIAGDLQLNEVQVRKDLESVSKTAGKPKLGYVTQELFLDLEEFLGYRNRNEAALVGAGSLGRALLSYRGFERYGVEIVTAFDKDEELVGTHINGKAVLPSDKIENICRRLGISIGIIAVPAQSAQEVCDCLVKAGVQAIWNFAPVHLTVPPPVLVQNENMAVSLAMLSKHLFELNRDQ